MQAADAPLAKKLEAAGSPGNKHTMEDVAKFIHGEMIANVRSSAAREIRDFNRRFADPNEPSFPPTLTGPASVPLADLNLGIEDKINTYGLWALRVAPSRDWDYKNPGSPGFSGVAPIDPKTGRPSRECYDPNTNSLYDVDIWGNVHYGYIGRAVEFSREELLNGAGLAQIKTIISQALGGNQTPLDEAVKRIKMRQRVI